MSKASIPSLELIENAHWVNNLLAKMYPNARPELNFHNPFELLVATVLSARSTDLRVNSVTPQLFSRYPDAETLAQANLAEIEQLIHPVGFYRNKALAIIHLSQQLVVNFSGVVPADFNSLISLSGVGPKTANVVLGNAFGIPALTPDTHFMRVSKRLGWSHATTPAAIEADVAKLFPPADWVQVSHRLIWHGRRRCHARNPACGACLVGPHCPSYGIGITDPIQAAALVRESRN